MSAANLIGIVEDLHSRVNKIQGLIKSTDQRQTGKGCKQLIISTGDISDVDGFFALAKYAQSGADVLFIMNYPAYLNPEIITSDPVNGLGFDFTIDDFLENADIGMASNRIYLDLRKKYNTFRTRDDPRGVKRIFTDLGFILASKVWSETQKLLSAGSPKGTLYFNIGGVNTISSFSVSAVKNEMAVYVDYLNGVDVNLTSYSETDTYDVYKNKVSINDLLGQCDQIYIDFNGSMAFYHGLVMDTIRVHARQGKIKGVFVMGGVYSFQTSQTMPKIDKVLNRFSCATMNQLYSPQKTDWFFDDMHTFSVPIFMVANNEIHDNTTKTAGDEQNTDVGWKSFLESNGIFSGFLGSLANTYYNNPYYIPPRKAFDYYTALAMTLMMQRTSFKTETKSLFFDKQYGICMISAIGSNWQSCVQEYFSLIDTKENPSDPLFIKKKKKTYTEEKAILMDYKKAKRIPVKIIRFDIDPDTRQLKVLDGNSICI